MQKRKRLFGLTAFIVLLSLLGQLILVPVGLAGQLEAPAASLATIADALISPERDLSSPQPAVATATADMPDAGHPLVISRVQSNYQAGATTVISLTVTNRLPIVAPPDIPKGATVTETAQLLSTIDPTLDPNTIRDVVIVDALTAAQYVDASPPPAIDAATLVWNVGSLAPGASKTVTLTVDVPATAPDFIDLDTGAAAYGALQGRLVQAQAAPARLAPDGFAQWLISTPDANTYDTAMLRGLGTIGSDATDIFAFIREFDFEAYTGSLRGTRGTLWSEAGNAVDQSSLLVAMLRATGIPARYRHGTLSTPHAQTLIASMFPEPTANQGHIPPGTPTSDPVNDPALIAEVVDHWWVEAYLSGSGWTDLDPTFTAANPGDSFATPTGDTTDRIAELPNATRHKVHLALEIEQYHEFPIGGSSLNRTTPLTATFNAVELVGLPISLAYLLDTEVQGGLAYGNIIYTYTPILRLGTSPTATQGETFEDLLTTFPLASKFTTGAWITVQTENPDGETDTFVREIKDLIGPDVRANGGDLQLAPVSDGPALSPGDLTQLQVVPQSRMPITEVDRARSDALAMSSSVGDAYLAHSALEDNDTTGTVDWIYEHGVKAQDAQVTALDLLGTTFYANATAPQRPGSAEQFLVTSYPDRPKLLLMNQSTISDTMTFSFELLSIHERSLAYPGQATNATIAANMMRTMGDKAIEYELLQQFDAVTVQSAYATVVTAIETDIPLSLITVHNLADLDSLTISNEAKGRIHAAALDGATVLAPVEPVLVDGELRTGWLEVDATGHAAFVDEQGRHATASTYALQAVMNFFALGPNYALIGGSVLTIVLFFANAFGTSLMDIAIANSMSTLASLLMALAQASFEALGICEAIGLFAGHCAAGVLIADLFIAPAITGKALAGDPTLPPTLYSREGENPDASLASAPVSFNSTTTATTLDVSATTQNLILLGQSDLNWTNNNQRGLDLTDLTAPTADLYKNGSLAASGALTLGSSPATAVLDGNDIDVSLTGEGSLSFYAPAVGGLGIGSDWQTYTAALDATQPYTLTLRNAEVIVDGGISYAGDLTARIDGSASIAGTSPTDGTSSSPLPLFQNQETIQAQATDLMAGPLAGTITAGGQPFPAVNGLAVAGLTGPVAVSENDATSDLVAFSGTADFFSLDLSTASSTIDPTQSATFDAVVNANFSDTYTVTAAAPRGWTVAVATDGTITASPPTGATPGNATILVTAQSAQYPNLFASATHTVTVTAFEGLELTIVEDPLITIPMGAIQDPNADTPGHLGHLVNGQAEIPDAAYTIVLTNTSTSAHTFDIAVTGLPAGWTLLSTEGTATATALTLDAGATGIVGLYVVPTNEHLPPQGTSYTIDVTAVAQDNGALQAADSALWTMPGIAFPFPTLTPATRYVAPGDPVSFTLGIENVGNVAGSFPVTLTMPTSVFNGTLLDPSRITSAETFSTSSLAPGETDTAVITLDTTGTAMGENYHVIAETASGLYRPTAFASVQIAGPLSGPLFRQLSCAPGGTLEDAISALGIAMLMLELSCDNGACGLADRNNVVNAANNLVAEINTAYPARETSAFAAATADLAAQTGDAGIETALTTLSDAAVDQAAAICENVEHQPVATLSPSLGAARPGDTITYTLTVENTGTLTTTYAITLTRPGGPDVSAQELAPGQTVDIAFPFIPATLGTYLMIADVVATGPDVTADVRASARAGLNVVDRFVQLTAVTADPPFVETGTSSTTLSVDVANVANVELATTARSQITTPDGSTVFTADVPLTVLRGDPRTYILTDVDTSGWTAGVYTITVDLLDSALAPIPDGNGYGFLYVGQALGASHTVSPTVVVPGTVTVTTVITTELLSPSIVPPAGNGPLWVPTGLRVLDASGVTENVAIPSPSDTPDYAVWVENRDFSPNTAVGQENTPSAPDVITGTVIQRHEQDEATLTGTWVNINTSWSSGGSYLRANAPGETAVFTVTGTWVALGFAANLFSGEAKVFIDGVSQGILDLYRREAIPVSFIYDGLASATHVISVTALGTRNAYASNDYVQLDYLDVYDGGTYTDGTFEQDNVRVWRSNGWNTANDAAASSGTYIRDDWATAWFPFTGDSVTYQALAYPGGGVAEIAIDGVLQTRFNLYNPLESVTRTLSFDGLGAGPHVLSLYIYRGFGTVDAFVTPGTAPFFTPPVPGDFTRYEEDDPGILYNSEPFTTTSQSWTRSDAAANSDSSGGQVIGSLTAGDTASFTFDGSWVSIGFFTDRYSGQAEIYLDSVSHGIVDLYSNENDVRSFSYDVVSGTHTISVTVLGTANPFAGNTRVYLDYIDIWNGNALPDGTFEQIDSRVLRSGEWVDVAASDASSGSYSEATLSTGQTAWFPFTGDSVTYQAYNLSRADEVIITIDEVFQGIYDIRTGASPTLTYAFDSLGAGLHILKLRSYRNEPTLDAFIAPATSTPPPPPTPTTFMRYEEDAQEVRYNGLPYTITASTWGRQDDENRASDGQYIATTAPGDTVSFDFTGAWVQIGLLTNAFGGRAEVFIDGVSQGIVDTYTTNNDVVSFAYSDLVDTTHTLSMTLLTEKHPNASGPRLLVDYFDTWNSAPLPAGTYEDEHPFVYRSDNYDDWNVIAEPAASSGSYLADDNGNDGTVWFHFTGDSITFQGLANDAGDRVHISIDGVSQGTFNMYNNTPVTRTFSFDGLGSGPHTLQIRHNRDKLNIDAFALPGSAPFYQPPVYTGIVRYEEEHPAIVYNGVDDFRTRPQSWVAEKGNNAPSGGWSVRSSAISDTVELTFDGTWVAVGFRVQNGTSLAEVFIDGISQGILDLDNDAGADVRSYQYGDLITGTHTISVTVVDGAVRFDYFDVWDSAAMDHDQVNVRRSEDRGRLHYSRTIEDVDNVNAIEGDYVNAGGVATANVWYSFVGDSFTLLGLTRDPSSSVDVYIDGVFTETADFGYNFTAQPRAYHYTDLDDGPHVVRIAHNSWMRLDAFQSNPDSTLPYLPSVEWWDTTPRGNEAPIAGTFGVVATITAGDVDGDGSVELAVAADDTANWGTLFLYRGDGADTGDGDPTIWSNVLGGSFTTREYLGAPTLVNLDGLPGAEIVVAGNKGLYAFYNDGSLYWQDTVPSGQSARGNPAVGNLDLDDEPEIVVNMNKRLMVYEADGTLAWQTTFTSEVGLPLLADMTGDGLLDIVVTDWTDHVRLFDYNLGSPNLVWTSNVTTSLYGLFGSPAIADIDGQQPGGDPEPEIAVTSNGLLSVFNADGSLLWSVLLGPGIPGGVSIADVDGDGEVEIVTGTQYDDGIGQGRLYVVNADGTILWDAPAYDSTSANSASVLDLDGDGIYEIAWNGREHGLTVFNGAEGSVLYNEPKLYSATATDYPNIADVDGDGYAEIIVPYAKGVAVVGMDGVWGDARPLWNQHSYHITNINDDLTVPAAEMDSWDIHNTYRTQTPLRAPLPVYDVTLTHTVGITGIAILTDTFNVTPDLEADPDYRWDYEQTSADQAITRTFDVRVDNLQPGESRQVAQATEVVYTLPSGTNQLLLPPLYVSAPHIIEVTPLSQTVGAGGTTIFDVVLTNPSAVADTYTLTLSGNLPNGWASLAPTVDVPATSAVTVALTMTVPAGTSLGTFDFTVTTTNNAGAQDRAAASLNVIDALTIAITPEDQTATTGTPVTYTLTITNNESVTRTYDLAALGVAAAGLPPTVTVPAGITIDLDLLVTAQQPGPNPFTVTASSSGGSTSTSAVVTAVGIWDVGATLNSSPASGGPAASTVMTLTVSNTGNQADTYDLAVQITSGWNYTLSANGSPITALTLQPGNFGIADLRLIVTPDASVAPGSYPITVTATSQTQTGLAAVAAGTLDVGPHGVTVDITDASGPLDPRTSATWDVTITNHGTVSDAFDLAVSGILGLYTDLPAATGTLNPGQSEIVQVTADQLHILQPGSYDFAVTATSQGDSAIRGEDHSAMTLSPYEDVVLHWQPAAQTVTSTVTADYYLAITNTGNVETSFALAFESIALNVETDPAEVVLPARGVVYVPVPVRAPGGGSYQVTAIATSTDAADIVTATLTVVLDNTTPVANAGANQSVTTGALVTLDGSASTDPDDDLPLIYGWTQIGGTAVTLSNAMAISPTFTAPSAATILTFTLTVTDSLGLVDPTPDEVVITVELGLDKTIYLPLVQRNYRP